MEESASINEFNYQKCIAIKLDYFISEKNMKKD